MIRYLNGDEKGASRDLWEEAFPEDSRSFDDYYFLEKMKDNRILVLEEEEISEKSESKGRDEMRLGCGEGGGQLEKSGSTRIASMIHLNPYWIQAAGEQWQVDYLVGVATRKDRRHRGYMRSLLNRMMEDMRDAGMPFCFLMPADAAIYRPFGFTYIFRQPCMGLKAGVVLEERELLGNRRAEGGEACTDKAGTLGGTEMTEMWMLPAWMNRWLASRYEVFAIRDEAYVCRLLKEIASENGSFRLLYDQGALVGMVSQWGLEEREQRLLYGEDSYVEEAEPPKPAIMARIITPENFVRAIRLDEAYLGEQTSIRPDGADSGRQAAIRLDGADSGGQITIRLRILDPLIRQNDGLWQWHLNRETSWMEPWDGTGGLICGAASLGLEQQSLNQGQGQNQELTLTIEEFTSWLFGYGIPEAVRAAGLDQVVRTLRGVFLDEIV